MLLVGWLQSREGGTHPVSAPDVVAEWSDGRVPEDQVRVGGLRVQLEDLGALEWPRESHAVPASAVGGDVGLRVAGRKRGRHDSRGCCGVVLLAR